MNIRLCALVLFAGIGWLGTAGDSFAAAAPQRIVTLMPSLGELATDILGEDQSRLVGVSDHSDYPPALARIAKVGSYAQVNLERVVALKPDLILASKDGNSKDQVSHLRELGLSVVVVETNTFEQVARSMRQVGEALGAPGPGEKMAAQFEKAIAIFRERAKKHRDSLGSQHPVPRVLLQVGEDPLVVAGRSTFLNEAIALLGATNVYGDSVLGYPRPNMEDVLRRAPTMIVVLATSPDMIPGAKRRWQQMDKLSAIKDGKLFFLEGDLLLRPTLRLLEGLAMLEKRLWGGAT